MKENIKFDMTVPCGNGLLNIRVGAIIMKKNKILMGANRKHPEYTVVLFFYYLLKYDLWLHSGEHGQADCGKSAV